ncbi:MAG TPA: tetratricopeptide repeat protein [Aquabacterium sp.]|nr:tetratricopeptide repeat protein [Aquabacterium sp.]
MPVLASASSHPLRARHALLPGLLSLALVAPMSWAAPGKPAAPPILTRTDSNKPPIQNSALDAPLFYQLLVAEMQANTGDAGSAYQLYLEAARRLQNSQLYQRAVEIALRARAGEQALSAAKAWRQAVPQSREASEYTAQILMALGRTTDLAAPLRTVIQLTPAPQQPQVIAGLPRGLQRIRDRQAAARVIDETTQPWRQPPTELGEAWAASGEGWLLAKDPAKALAAVQRAIALQPNLLTAGLVAADLIDQTPAAEEIVRQQLARPDASDIVRLAYARKLTLTQRYGDAAAQLDTLVQRHPEEMGHWLLLAALRLEMRQLDPAEAALKPVLARQKPSGISAGAPPAVTDGELEQAYLLMSQIAEQRKKPKEALEWIDRADPKHEKMAIQGQRARLLMTQGRLSEARQTLRALPESEPRDAVLKYQAEAQLLRDARQWQEAYRVLSEATQRFPDDSDLLYDRAMLADRLHLYDDMVQLLRKVIEISPDNPNAYNALGYSLADRGVQLDEARTLINKALSLRPGDPFITDSLGWLEFRQGRHTEALRLLQEAWDARPDAEIAAHLGEVLWQQDRHDEARAVWRQGLAREPDNETLKGTLKRLKVQP